MAHAAYEGLSEIKEMEEEIEEKSHLRGKYADQVLFYGVMIIYAIIHIPLIFPLLPPETPLPARLSWAYHRAAKATLAADLQVAKCPAPWKGAHAASAM